MQKICKLLFLMVIATTLLSGCMYPEDKLAKNQTPYLDQIQAVQTAVDKFQKDNGGILPIKTKEQNTPIYQKYLIDFNRLTPQYLAEPPGNSFEAGGVFQYVLTDVEKNPTVKIFDLRIAETIRDIKIRLKMQDYPPYKKQIANNVYSLNFKELGYKEEPVAVSPYSNQNLSFVITGDVEVYVDYRSDLYQALQKTKHSYKPGDDIRDILLKDSMFVPAYSLPTTIDQNGEPIFLMK